MSNICIDVEFLAGCDIEKALIEAKQLAKKLDVAYICFSFNGTKMSIGQNADVNKVINQYHKHPGDGLIVES